MAIDLNLVDVSSGYETNTINNNFEAIETALQDAVSRSGDTPNQLNTDLDFNGYNLINVGNFTDLGISVQWDWKGAWVGSSNYVINDVVRNDGSTYLCREAHLSDDFATELAEGKWELVASRGSVGLGTGDMLAENNLSDLDSASTSRTNLGVAIGSNVQAYSDVLENTTASYTTEEETKLAGIETAADVTDWDNISSAIQLASPSIITGNTNDQILVRDISASNEVKLITIDDILDKIDYKYFGGAPHVVYEDQRSSGNNGGTFTAGGWRTRNINTEVRNVDNWGTRNGDKVKFDYNGWVEWEAIANDVDNHQSRLRNVTDNNTISYSMPVRDDTVESHISKGGGAVQAGDWYEIQHRCTFTRSGYGLGNGCNLGTEVFLRLKYWRR